MKNYDVVIVGAGNAGLMTAATLFGSGLSVLLLDKNPNPLVPTNHIYGTFFETVQKYNLQDFIINRYDTFVFQCPGKVIKFDWSKRPFCCVDTHKWVAGLKLDCEIQGGVQILGARRVNDGIKIQIDNGQEIITRMAVDCSGDAKILSKFLGIKTNKQGYVDLTYICSNCDVSRINEVVFMTDLRYFNISGWWYPYNQNEGFFGLSNLNDLRDYSKEEMEKNKDAFVRDNEPFTSYLKNANSKFELFKIGPPTKINEKITDNNFIAVGDAAGAGTTLCGEGFRVALEMGEQAGKTIISAFKRGDLSRPALSSYEYFYEQRYGRFAFWGRVFTYFFVRAGSNTLVRLLFTNAKKYWSEDQMYAFAKNELTPKLLYELINLRVVLIGLKNLSLYFLGIPFSKE